MIEYKMNDKNLSALQFISFVNQVWEGNYDLEKTRYALSKTMNITAYDKDKLVGCLRILTDGYYFGTITELLVLPEYQKLGIGRKLWEYVLKHSSRNVFTVNSSPYAVPVYHKLGFTDTDTEQLSDGMRYTPMKFVNV